MINAICHILILQVVEQWFRGLLRSKKFYTFLAQRFESEKKIAISWPKSGANSEQNIHLVAILKYFTQVQIDIFMKSKC